MRRAGSNGRHVSSERLTSFRGVLPREGKRDRRERRRDAFASGPGCRLLCASVDAEQPTAPRRPAPVLLRSRKTARRRKKAGCGLLRHPRMGWESPEISCPPHALTSADAGRPAAADPASFVRFSVRFQPTTAGRCAVAVRPRPHGRPRMAIFTAIGLVRAPTPHAAVRPDCPWDPACRSRGERNRPPQGPRSGPSICQRGRSYRGRSGASPRRCRSHDRHKFHEVLSLRAAWRVALIDEFLSQEHLVYPDP